MGGRNKVLSVNAYETKSLPAHRHKGLRFLCLETVLESVRKKAPVIRIWFRATSTKSRGLLSGIIIKIIQRISPVSKITGYLFTYGLFAAFSS